MSLDKRDKSLQELYLDTTPKDLPHLATFGDETRLKSKVFSLERLLTWSKVFSGSPLDRDRVNGSELEVGRGGELYSLASEKPTYQMLVFYLV